MEVLHDEFVEEICACIRVAYWQGARALPPYMSAREFGMGGVFGALGEFLQYREGSFY
jgi:hypothetical protein